MSWLDDLRAYEESGRAVCIVTVVATQGSTPREPGAKMLVDADGTLRGTVGGGRLEELAREAALTALREGKPRLERYPLGASAGQCCGGVVDLFFEPLYTGPVLALFGVGHVGQALCRTLVGTPFTVHAVDERTEWITAPELPPGVVRHAMPWDEALPSLLWDARRTFVCVMTHRHDVDEAIIGDVLSRPTRFVGLIGSKTKWAKIQARLRARGQSEDALARVQCPLGLPLGGKSPAEVAISIAAELLRVFHALAPASTP